MKPKFSIITPVYNGAPYIDDLIRSVINQDYEPLEHIIIDDGSTDGGETVLVLERYPHLRWWARENRGQYATMNEGLLAAEGEVVCFISADDLMEPDSVRRVVNHLQENAHLDGVYGCYAAMNSLGKERKYIQPFRYAPTSQYPYTLHISHSSLYLRKAVLLEHHLQFDEGLHYVGDYEWIVKILRSPLKLGRLWTNLSTIRVHEQQTSTTYFYPMREETLRVQKELMISPLFASLARKVYFAARLFNVTCDQGILAAVDTLKNRLDDRGR